MNHNGKRKYPTMTKSEFISRLIVLRPNLLPNDVQETAQKIFDYMCDTLSHGGRIEIRGFGSFCLRHRTPRIARNPKTGEQFQLPSRSVPYFRPGKKLRNRVNGNSVSNHANSTVSSSIMPLYPLSSSSQQSLQGSFAKGSSEGGDNEA